MADPITGAALVGAAGLSALGGMAGSAMSQAMQYNYQKKLQQQQQQWQERMSNTAHQRQKADLLKAGINPLLTATGGNGASTPSGGMGQAGLTDIGGNVQKGISSAIEFQQLKNQTSLSKAQTGLFNAQTDTETTKALLNQIQSAETMVNTMLKQKDLDWADKKYAQMLEEGISKTKLNYASATANQINAEANMMNAQTNKIVGSANAKKLKGETALLGRPKSITESFNNDIKILGIGTGAGRTTSYTYY